ncbi:unnamed protein product, partial [Rhizoctonia solani]
MKSRRDGSYGTDGAKARHPGTMLHVSGSHLRRFPALTGWIGSRMDWANLLPRPRFDGPSDALTRPNATFGFDSGSHDHSLVTAEERRTQHRTHVLELIATLKSRYKGRAERKVVVKR